MNSAVAQTAKQRPKDPSRRVARQMRSRLLRRKLQKHLRKRLRKQQPLHKRLHHWLVRPAHRPISVLHATASHSAAVQMDPRRLTDPMARVVVCRTASAVAQTILLRPEDREAKDAAANTHRMAAARTTAQLPGATIMRDADANIRASVAALTSLLLLLDLNSKDAHAIHSNSAAAPMASPSHQVRIITVAIARKPSSSAAQTASPQPRDQIQRAVHVRKVSMAAAWTVSHQRRDRGSRDAIVCRQLRRKHAVLRRTAAIAQTTRLSTSSTLNTEVVHGSGTAVAAAMRTASKPLRTVRAPAKSQLARAPAHCRRFMDHVPATIRCITTIPIAMLALNSFSAAAWATIIALKRLRHARNSVSSTNLCVS